MKKHFYLLLISIVFVMNTSAQEGDSIIIYRAEFEELEKIKIKPGDQKIIHRLPITVDIGFGPVLSYLFEIPTIKSDKPPVYQFSSLLVGNTFYAPLYILLDENYNIIDIIDEELNITPNPLKNDAQITEIIIDPPIKYILQTSYLGDVKERFDHEITTNNSVGIYTGSTMVFIPVGSSTFNTKVSYSKTPKTKLITPVGKNIEIFERTTGLYTKLGVDFGGARVANNTNGDDYRVGGGAVMLLGYSHIIHGSCFSVSGGLGYRYQGAQERDASNQGGLLESVAYFQTKYINIGVGGQFDFANKIRDEEGEIYKFGSEIGPKVVLDIKFTKEVSMGLEYIHMDFTDTRNKMYSGNRLMLSVKLHSGSL